MAQVYFIINGNNQTEYTHTFRYQDQGYLDDHLGEDSITLTAGGQVNGYDYEFLSGDYDIQEFIDIEIQGNILKIYKNNVGGGGYSGSWKIYNTDDGSGSNYATLYLNIDEDEEQPYVETRLHIEVYPLTTQANDATITTSHFQVYVQQKWSNESDSQWEDVNRTNVANSCTWVPSLSYTHNSSSGETITFYATKTGVDYGDNVDIVFAAAPIVYYVTLDPFTDDETTYQDSFGYDEGLLVTIDISTNLPSWTIYPDSSANAISNNYGISVTKSGNNIIISGTSTYGGNSQQAEDLIGTWEIGNSQYSNDYATIIIQLDGYIPPAPTYTYSIELSENSIELPARGDGSVQRVYYKGYRFTNGANKERYGLPSLSLSSPSGYADVSLDTQPQSGYDGCIIITRNSTNYTSTNDWEGGFSIQAGSPYNASADISLTINGVTTEYKIQIDNEPTPSDYNSTINSSDFGVYLYQKYSYESSFTKVNNTNLANSCIWDPQLPYTGSDMSGDSSTIEFTATYSYNNYDYEASTNVVFPAYVEPLTYDIYPDETDLVLQYGSGDSLADSYIGVTTDPSFTWRVMDTSSNIGNYIEATKVWSDDYNDYVLKISKRYSTSQPNSSIEGGIKIGESGYAEYTIPTTLVPYSAPITYPYIVNFDSPSSLNNNDNNVSNTVNYSVTYNGSSSSYSNFTFTVEYDWVNTPPFATGTPNVNNYVSITASGNTITITKLAVDTGLCAENSNATPALIAASIYGTAADGKQVSISQGGFEFSLFGDQEGTYTYYLSLSGPDYINNGDTVYESDFEADFHSYLDPSTSSNEDVTSQCTFNPSLTYGYTNNNSSTNDDTQRFTATYRHDNRDYSGYVYVTLKGTNSYAVELDPHSDNKTIYTESLGYDEGLLVTIDISTNLPSWTYYPDSSANRITEQYGISVSRSGNSLNFSGTSTYNLSEDLTGTWYIGNSEKHDYAQIILQLNGSGGGPVGPTYYSITLIGENDITFVANEGNSSVGGDVSTNLSSVSVFDKIPSSGGVWDYIIVSATTSSFVVTYNGNYNGSNSIDGSVKVGTSSDPNGDETYSVITVHIQPPAVITYSLAIASPTDYSTISQANQPLTSNSFTIHLCENGVEGNTNIASSCSFKYRVAGSNSSLTNGLPPKRSQSTSIDYEIYAYYTHSSGELNDNITVTYSGTGATYRILVSNPYESASYPLQNGSTLYKSDFTITLQVSYNGGTTWTAVDDYDGSDSDCTISPTISNNGWTNNNTDPGSTEYTIILTSDVGSVSSTSTVYYEGSTTYDIIITSPGDDDVIAYANQPLSANDFDVALYANGVDTGNNVASNCTFYYKVSGSSGNYTQGFPPQNTSSSAIVYNIYAHYNTQNIDSIPITVVYDYNPPASVDYYIFIRSSSPISSSDANAITSSNYTSGTISTSSGYLNLYVVTKTGNTATTWGSNLTVSYDNSLLSITSNAYSNSFKYKKYKISLASGYTETTEQTTTVTFSGHDVSETFEVTISYTWTPPTYGVEWEDDSVTMDAKGSASCKFLFASNISGQEATVSLSNNYVTLSSTSNYGSYGYGRASLKGNNNTIDTKTTIATVTHNSDSSKTDQLTITISPVTFYLDQLTSICGFYQGAYGLFEINGAPGESYTLTIENTSGSGYTYSFDSDQLVTTTSGTIDSDGDTQFYIYEIECENNTNDIYGATLYAQGGKSERTDSINLERVKKQSHWYVTANPTEFTYEGGTCTLRLDKTSDYEDGYIISEIQGNSAMLSNAESLVGTAPSRLTVLENISTAQRTVTIKFVGDGSESHSSSITLRQSGRQADYAITATPSLLSFGENEYGEQVKQAVTVSSGDSGWTITDGATGDWWTCSTTSGNNGDSFYVYPTSTFTVREDEQSRSQSIKIVSTANSSNFVQITIVQGSIVVGNELFIPVNGDTLIGSSNIISFEYFRKDDNTGNYISCTEAQFLDSSIKGRKIIMNIEAEENDISTHTVKATFQIGRRFVGWDLIRSSFHVPEDHVQSSSWLTVTPTREYVDSSTEYVYTTINISANRYTPQDSSSCYDEEGARSVTFLLSSNLKTNTNN